MDITGYSHTKYSVCVLVFVQYEAILKNVKCLKIGYKLPIKNL